MLQITREGEYAFRAMLYIASKPDGVLSRVSEMSKAADIPASYLSKIMRRLRTAGLVESYRGSLGGFRLARSADSITLRDTIEAVEGPLTAHRSPDGAGNGACATVWEEAQRSFLKVLGGKTIGSVLSDERENGVVGKSA
jgi:Rrf2 family transcriptional regulator, iron-sulfur cluster assembly transcription factor